MKNFRHTLKVLLASFGLILGAVPAFAQTPRDIAAGLSGAASTLRVLATSTLSTAQIDGGASVAPPSTPTSNPAGGVGSPSVTPSAPSSVQLTLSAASDLQNGGPRGPSGGY